MKKQQGKLFDAAATVKAPRKRYTYTMPHQDTTQPNVVTTTYDAAYKQLVKHHFFSSEPPTIEEFKSEFETSDVYEINDHVWVKRS